MKVYRPGSNISIRDKSKLTIFLAGSIEMGTAMQWQNMVETYLNDEECNIINPRTDDIDQSYPQDFNDPNFYKMTNWELNGLDVADVILMFFDPAAKSPVSLLELGLYAGSGRMRVVCPDGFWRRGNVEMVCERHDIQFYEHLNEALDDLREHKLIVKSRDGFQAAMQSLRTLRL